MSSRRGTDIGQGQCDKITSNSDHVKTIRIKETVNRTGTGETVNSNHLNPALEISSEWPGV